MLWVVCLARIPLDYIFLHCTVLHYLALQYWGGVGVLRIEVAPRAKLIVPCTWLDPIIVPPKNTFWCLAKNIPVRCQKKFVQSDFCTKGFLATIVALY